MRKHSLLRGLERICRRRHIMRVWCSSSRICKLGEPLVRHPRLCFQHYSSESLRKLYCRPRADRPRSRVLQIRSWKLHQPCPPNHFPRFLTLRNNSNNQAESHQTTSSPYLRQAIKKLFGLFKLMFTHKLECQAPQPCHQAFPQSNLSPCPLL